MFREDSGCSRMQRDAGHGCEENRRLISQPIKENDWPIDRPTDRPARAGHAPLSLSSLAERRTFYYRPTKPLFLASISRGRPVASSPSPSVSATDLANRWRRRRRDCGLTAKLSRNVISCSRDSLLSPLALHSRLSSEYTMSRFRSSALKSSTMTKKRIFLGPWKFHLKYNWLIREKSRL